MILKVIVFLHDGRVGLPWQILHVPTGSVSSPHAKKSVGLWLVTRHSVRWKSLKAARITGIFYLFSLNTEYICIINPLNVNADMPIYIPTTTNPPRLNKLWQTVDICNLCTPKIYTENLPANQSPA